LLLDILVLLAQISVQENRGAREVHFHFIPTCSSWLNMVEVWFSILSRQALRNLSATSVPQLRKAIDHFVDAYSETATPFEWTKAMVEPSAPRRRYSDLCK
jgi:hypothetical protein